MQQSGGSNATSFLTIGAGGQYQLTGGTLQISAAMLNQGIVDGGNRPATLSANCLVDLDGRHLAEPPGHHDQHGANSDS